MGTEVSMVEYKINEFLVFTNPQEYLFDRQEFNAKIHCKTLCQVDLLEYHTNANKIGNEGEPGGAKQILFAINNTRILLTEIQK